MSKFDVNELRDDTVRLHKSTLKVPNFPAPNAQTLSIPQRDAPVQKAEKEDQRAHPLKRHSLRGSSAHLERIAVDQTPILDGLCLAGQLTVWYGPPNAGKTLICGHLLVKAVEELRVDPENVIYVDVDDSTLGLAQKVGILEQRNVHVLGEGQNGFSSHKLIKALRDTIDQKKAHGLFVILDTMKKFVSLMDKKESSSFNTLLRQFAAAGGTALCVAHTNKRADSNGELVHAGTSDVREDFDAAYILAPREQDSDENRRVVEFKSIKGRGGGEDRVLFAYDCSPQATYDERFASVTRLDPSGFAPIQTRAETRLADVISAIEDRIVESPVQKMDLVKDVGATVGIGRQSVVKVLNDLTGTDPLKHRWTYDVGHRGAKYYRLLEKCAPGDQGG